MLKKDVQSVFDHPLLSAEGTVFRRPFFRPFQDAVEVKVMEALTLNWYAIVSRHFASRTGRFKGELANSTAFLCLDVPFPSGYGIPGIDFDLHLF